MTRKAFIRLGFAAILLHTAPVWGDSTLVYAQAAAQNSIERLGTSMAAHILRCTRQAHDSDAVAARTFAFLLLRMPVHAEEALNAGKAILAPIDTAQFEGAIESVISEQNVEYENLLETYVVSARSPKLLLNAYLSELRSSIGSEVLTDAGTNSAAYDEPIGGWTNIVITISINWLNVVCSTGSYRQLADQLQLVAELCRQPRWKVFVVTSKQLDKQPMSVQTFVNQSRKSNALPVILPGDMIFSTDAQQRQLACENVALKALDIAR
jgi:hypothetical protein